MSRVASVFANAVFGALAVVLFTGIVGRETEGIGLDARDRQEVMAETAKLGDAKVPEDIIRGSGDWGVAPKVAPKLDVNEPTLESPTATQISATERSVPRSRAAARSSRRVSR